MPSSLVCSKSPFVVAVVVVAAEAAMCIAGVGVVGFAAAAAVVAAVAVVAVADVEAGVAGWGCCVGFVVGCLSPSNPSTWLPLEV